MDYEEEAAPDFHEDGTINISKFSDPSCHDRLAQLLHHVSKMSLAFLMQQDHPSLLHWAGAVKTNPSDLPPTMDSPAPSPSPVAAGAEEDQPPELDVCGLPETTDATWSAKSTLKPWQTAINSIRRMHRQGVSYTLCQRGCPCRSCSCLAYNNH